MADPYFSYLRLLQLADSALPIGTTAHSFGLETLVVNKSLAVGNLEVFIQDYVSEAGLLEAVFCRAAHTLGSDATQASFAPEWLALNRQISAFKPARESRIASATLGRRFLTLVCDLGEWPLLETAVQVAKSASADIHHCTSFGLVGSCLGIDEELAVLAYMNQMVNSLVSACQRLLPLGQRQASRILWHVKPLLTQIAQQSRTFSPDDVSCFTPLLDLGGMRHPTLTTRLFIS